MKGLWVALLFASIILIGLVSAEGNVTQVNVTCSTPVCEGVYFTGNYTLDHCPIYSCPNSTQICKDSDGGANYNVKGSLSYSVPNGPQGNFNDFCNGKTLSEYSCSDYASTGYFYKYEEYNCPNGCNDGACIQSPPTTNTSMPADMDACLSNPTNYWDQETDQCYGGFSKEMIANSCSDPDGGMNLFVQAHTYGFRSSFADSKDQRIRTGGLDSCISDKQLVEHYCDDNGYIQTNYLDCVNGCTNGACIKGPDVTETITCNFKNSNAKQRCYLAGQWSESDLGTKYCDVAAGLNSCQIKYTSFSGEKVTWKSTCGNYQYTTQDGQDESVYFDCGAGETNTTQISGNGFKNAYWQCYNGKEWKSDGNNCLSSELWQKKAVNFCNGQCKGNKCGVNSFSVGSDCYVEESSLCQDGESTTQCCNRWAKENGIAVPACVGGWNIENDKCSYSCKETESNVTLISATICKDSCSSDGKCYPFGYRKDGNYCSDTSSFVSQLKSNDKCDNNFECSTNVCVSGKCISEGLIQKILNWFSRLFGGG